MKLLIWLKVLVFIDFFAVALVLPILSSYFRDAGLSVQSYGLITSLYATAQLLGSLVLGVLSDYTSKKGILLLSFAGSGLSYVMVGLGKNYIVLLASRVVVGLVKQTMTTTTLMIAELTEDNHAQRSIEMGQLAAISSFSFVIGPSIGGILYKYNSMLPASLAFAMFGLNFVLCYLVIPSDSESAVDSKQTKQDSIRAPFSFKLVSLQSLPQYAYTLLTSPGGIIFLFRQLISFTQASMSSSHLLNYYEERFGVETYDLGFLTSATTMMSLVSQSCLVGFALKLCKHEVIVIAVCFVVIGLANVIESINDDRYVIFVCSLLPSTLVSSVLDTASKAMLINSIPASNLGTMLSSANMVTSIVWVFAPLYGSYTLTALGDIRYKGLLAAAHDGVLVLIALWVFQFIQHTQVNTADDRIRRLLDKKKVD
ncbi:MFS transporter [archaeon]|nr:MAG: MFS transporter [archaeon]